MAKKIARTKSVGSRKSAPARKTTARKTSGKKAAAPAKTKKISFKVAKRSLEQLHANLSSAGGRAPAPDLADAIGKVSEAVSLVRAACAPETMARAFAIGPSSRKR